MITKATVLILIIICSVCKAQITENNIKQLLIAQGIDNPATNAEILYNQYTENKKFDDIAILNKALGESALSGLSMGFYQTRNAWNHKDIGWLPKFMQNWYMDKPGVNNIFGQFFTWQKIFREIDYMNDRLAYEDLNKFFEGKWFLATITDMLVKNLTGAMIRNRMSMGRLF
jgi:hypothetical protein